jgi:hypothetical protein
LSHQVVESFPPLDKVPGIQACFFRRIPTLEVSLERHEAMARLTPYHHQLLWAQGLGNFPLITAEQVHGKNVAIVQNLPQNADKFPAPIAGVDGLVTRARGITLGIMVADCAPIWIVAKDGSSGALLHSGKKGTEYGIFTEGFKALSSLGLETQTPSDFLALIGPCIRPPCYEIDFAATIRRQAQEAGLLDIHDAEICTACHPEHYYSYRREHGLTGRMLATLTLLPA